LKQKEFTISEIFDKIVSIIILLKRNYLLIISIMGGFSFLGVLNRADEIYTAKTTILLPSSNKSSVLSMIGQFGVNDKKEITFGKFKSIASSNSNLKTVLLEEIKINGVSDKIIHFLMDELKLRKFYSKSGSNLSKVNFDTIGLKQDTVMNYVINQLKKRLTVKETIGELIQVETFGKSEFLAVEINNKIVSQTVNFFDDFSVLDDVNTLKNLKKRRDSIKNLLNQEEIQLAFLKDAAFRTVKSKGHLELLRSERQFQILDKTYVELIKQMEIISFKIDNNRLNITIIDNPMLPLNGERKSLTLIILFHSLIGFATSLLLLIGYPFILKGIKKIKSA
jgi:uncharacterized protein involved in exopolysaccharide biosynthesis